jgi:hypothetical protein
VPGWVTPVQVIVIVSVASVGSQATPFVSEFVTVSLTATLVVEALGVHVKFVLVPVVEDREPEAAVQFTVDAVGVVTAAVAVKATNELPSAATSSCDAVSFRSTGQPETKTTVPLTSTIPASAAAVTPWHTIDTFAWAALPATTDMPVTTPLQVISG